jgi:hypothetical protein
MPKVGLCVANNGDILESECYLGHTAREREYMSPTKAVDYVTNMWIRLEVFSYNSSSCLWLYKNIDDNSMQEKQS